MTIPNTIALNRAWQDLNAARKRGSLKPLSYSALADFASCADTPGEPMSISKSTVAAVLKGNYTSATEPAIRARLAQVIKQKHKDLGTSFPGTSRTDIPVGLKPAQASKKPRRSQPRITHTRCNYQGYITYRNHTYYLGPRYVGQVAVFPLRDRAHGIRATTPYLTRTAYPIDPSTNQLGYEAASK